MRRILCTSGVATGITLISQSATAGAICSGIGHCVTYSCYAYAYASCIGGDIVGSVLRAIGLGDW